MYTLTLPRKRGRELGRPTLRSPGAGGNWAASSPSPDRSIKVNGANRADRVEAVLRHADATLETWFRRAKKRSALALRQGVDNLQGGLKKLSVRWEQSEGEPKPAPIKRRARPAIARKPSAPRKRKKAA